MQLQAINFYVQQLVQHLLSLYVNNLKSTIFISPKKKYNWLMAFLTFFLSQHFLLADWTISSNSILSINMTSSFTKKNTLFNYGLIWSIIRISIFITINTTKEKDYKNKRNNFFENFSIEMKISIEFALQQILTHLTKEGEEEER